MRKIMKGMGFLLLVLVVILPCRSSIQLWRRGDILDVLQEVQEIEREEKAEAEQKWRVNIRPEPENKIHLTWSYRPTRLGQPPQGVNVLAPTWFYVADEKGDGIPRLKDITQMGVKGDLKQYVKDAHKNDRQVWATVVSFTPKLSDYLIHNEAYRQAFKEKLVDYARKLELDGINFDFENMNPAHKMDYTEFIKDCSQVLKPLGLVISVDVTVKAEFINLNNWYQCYDHKSLGETADYVAVMTYDEHKNHSSAGPVASIGWVEEKLQGILQDVPSDKILLGIPFYAYDFRSTMIDGDPDQLEPIWSYEKRGVITILKRQIDELLEKDEYIDLQKKKVQVKEWIIKDEWDEGEGTFRLKFIDQDDLVHEIWYDEERSLAMKARLVKEYHLAGAAVWQQDFGIESFWDAVDQNIR